MENIGKQLKEKRLELGLTIEDVCLKTRLTQKHIKALEEGNLSFFHDDLSYLRFFVKSYCEVVDIDFENIKDELRESVDDYTQTLSLNTQMMHEEIEKNIAHSEQLSKVQSDDAQKATSRKHIKPLLNKKIRKLDFSFLSLVIVVCIVVVILVVGLTMFIRSNDTDQNVKKENQPVLKSDSKDPYPTTDETDKKEDKKEIEVVKNGQTQYNIDNAEDGDELKFEVYFGGSNSGFSVTVDDVVLNEPAAKIYNFQETAKATIKAKKGSKIQIYVGWLYDTSIKLNGKNVKIDDAIARSGSQYTFEFTVTGEE